MRSRRISNATIAMEAYHMWLEEGQPVGRDQEHWERACERVRKQLRRWRGDDDDAEAPSPLRV